MFLLVGLGNVGYKYTYSRHNVGFLVVDQIVDQFGLNNLGKKNNSMLFKGKIGKKNILVMKPLTMMNQSGKAVSNIKNFYKIPLEKVFVFYDEIDLTFLKLKVKIGGSSAGHNGIKSIDKLIERNYYRIRIGIGKPEKTSMINNFVLSNFTNTQLINIKNRIFFLVSNLEYLLEYKLDIFLSNIYKEIK